MRIRPATPADFPTVRDIAHRTWPVTFGDILTPGQIAYMLEMMYSVAALREQTAQRGHRFIIAEDDTGTAVAYASYELAYLPGTTKLHKLYVLPEEQGTGLGRALTAEVEAAARAAGDHVLRLDVNRDNAAAGFYERTGFTKVGAATTDIGEGYVMDDAVYERRVEGPGAPRTAGR